MNCNKCQSSDVIEVGSFYISKKYEGSIGGRTHPETGSISIPIVKYACLECGHVFEKISKENANKYKEIRPYFK